jgi:glycosyltransferase involved in cell wall biosynthesis
MRHPNKVLWLLHQYRAAYDLWDAPIGDLGTAPHGRATREAIRRADEALIPECRGIYTISRNVSDRLQRYNRIASRPLYHPPPGAERFREEEAEDFLYCPGRINPAKRQHLIVEALLLCREKVRVVFSGVNDSSGYAAETARSAEKGRLGDRVTWRGRVSEDDKYSLYARCRGVLVPPIDEDYGYVALEAMASAKPVITCSDSGGPLDFVHEGETGAICAPTPSSLAQAMDALWRDRARARQQGRAGLMRYRLLNLNWPDVVGQLLA